MRISQRPPPRLQELATELTNRTRAPIALDDTSSKQFESAITASDLPAASGVDVSKLQRANMLSHRSERELAIAWTKLGHEMKPTGKHNILFLDIPKQQFFAQQLGPEGKDLKGPFPLTPDLMGALERDMTKDLERSKEAMRYRDD